MNHFNNLMEDLLNCPKEGVMELAIFLGAGFVMMLMTLSLQKYIYNRAYARQDKNMNNNRAPLANPTNETELN